MRLLQTYLEALSSQNHIINIQTEIQLIVFHINTVKMTGNFISYNI